jgi:hypothetical protein
MVDQCDAGGQIHLALIPKLTSCSVALVQDDSLSQLIYFASDPILTVFGHEHRITTMAPVLDTLWWINVVPAASSTCSSSRRLRVCSVALVQDDSLSRLIYLLLTIY